MRVLSHPLIFRRTHGCNVLFRRHVHVVVLVVMGVMSVVVIVVMFVAVIGMEIFRMVVLFGIVCHTIVCSIPLRRIMVDHVWSAPAPVNDYFFLPVPGGRRRSYVTCSRH